MWEERFEDFEIDLGNIWETLGGTNPQMLHDILTIYGVSLVKVQITEKITPLRGRNIFHLLCKREVFSICKVEYPMEKTLNRMLRITMNSLGYLDEFLYISNIFIITAMHRTIYIY